MPRVPPSSEHHKYAGHFGGKARAKALGPKGLRQQMMRVSNARWAGLTPEERKIERAKGRTPNSASNTRWAGMTPEERKIEWAKGRTPKSETEPAANTKAAKS